MPLADVTMTEERPVAVRPRPPRFTVRARLEVDVDVTLSADQLDGVACAVCGFFLGAPDVDPPLPTDNRHVGSVVEVVGNVVRTYELYAHHFCADSLKVEVSEDCRVWPW